MNPVEKSDHIKAGIQKGFRDGTSKMAERRCYGYDTASDGTLTINPTEAKVVIWIFGRYLQGDSLKEIVDALEQQGIPSPSGKIKWNREAVNKMLSNEKYTGSVLLQKTISTGVSQLKNDGFSDRYLLTNHHAAIISKEVFEAVQEEKLQRNPSQENKVAMSMQLW